MRISTIAGGFVAIALAALAVGCSAAAKAPAATEDGPGSSVVADVISCKVESDCKSGETCGSGFCQMKRCASPSYDSSAPLGKLGYAFTDRAFVTAADTQLQVFSAYAKGGSTITAEDPPLDIAGGNLTGSRPESFAYVADGSNGLVILAADGTTKQIDLGFQGARVATGDVDGDGIDDIVVSGPAGQYALCNAVAASCTSGTVTNVIDDLAIGDLDGDGNGELLFIGNHTLTIVDASNNVTTQPVTATIVSLTAGDIDGDGKAEILGVDAGGTFTSNKLHVFRLSASLTDDSQVDLGHVATPDIAFAKQGDQPSIALLTNGDTLQTYLYVSNALVAGSSVAVAGGSAHRLAVADVDGRSAVVRLKGAPSLAIGPPVPLAVLSLPPYSGEHSAGPSSATMGNSSDSGSSVSNGGSTHDGISLMLSGGIKIPLGPASVSLHYYSTQTWGHTVSKTKQTSSSTAVGGSYTLTAAPDLDGYNSGGVVLAGGCFHRYDYAVEDPANVLGGASADITTFVPVGGETTLWSTARYNALVDALADGRLPKVAIAPRLGNVASYPSTPTTLDGNPIPDADNVFPDTPTLRTSDVGVVGFSLTTTTSTTNTAASEFKYTDSQALQVGASISVADVSAQGGVDTGFSLDQSYSLTVGSSSSFSGQVSPVRDDPSTPGNEASLFGYSFRPYVYRHHFKDSTGRDGAFYALTYSVGD